MSGTCEMAGQAAFSYAWYQVPVTAAPVPGTAAWLGWLLECRAGQRACQVLQMLMVRTNARSGG